MHNGKRNWSEQAINEIRNEANIDGPITEVKLAGSFKCSSAEVLNQVVSDVGSCVDEENNEGGLKKLEIEGFTIDDHNQLE